VIGQKQHDDVFLIHTGDVRLAVDRPARLLGRVYDRANGTLYPFEILVGSIVKFGYWEDFSGGAALREQIEREVTRLARETHVVRPVWLKGRGAPQTLAQAGAFFNPTVR
jgi:hypothetical protein